MEENKLVSVVIPTYNRFKYLLNTIESVKNQTHKNIEIIVVNDFSKEEKYYKYDWEKEGIKIINLPENSRKKFGFPCPGGYQRNFGIEIAKGDYIAFCDDDDIWFPKKIELQLRAMEETGCKMSSTDGLIGNGVYDKNKKYKKYNAEFFLETLCNIYKRRGIYLEKGFPKIWNLKFLKIHNCMICSSVIISKDVIYSEKQKFKIMKTADDYEYWRRILKHTDSVYLEEPCFYYDANHGAGQNY